MVLVFLIILWIRIRRLLAVAVGICVTLRSVVVFLVLSIVLTQARLVLLPCPSLFQMFPILRF